MFHIVLLQGRAISGRLLCIYSLLLEKKFYDLHLISIVLMLGGKNACQKCQNSVEGGKSAL